VLSEVPSSPKPLAPVGDKFFFQLLVRQLRSRGVRRLVMCTGYLADQIEDEFGNGHEWDVAIDYLEESRRLVHDRPRDHIDLPMRGHFTSAPRSRNSPKIFQSANCGSLLGANSCRYHTAFPSFKPVFALCPTTPRSGLHAHSPGCLGSPSEEMEN
jgi:hypothetical protein